MKPDRVVIGADDKRALEVLRALYAPFTRTNDRIQVMDRRSAELTKYAANSMLATRISFMNELANLCELVGADIEPVRKGMGSDPRIGTKFLFAGPGFGGTCFPKDLRAAVSTGRRSATSSSIVDAVVAVNERQKRKLGEKVLAHFGGNLEGQAHRGLGPRVQARDRRHPRGAGAGARSTSCWRRARRSSRDDPEAMEDRAQAARRSHRTTRSRTTRAPRAPTRSCWSPSGTSSGARRSRASRR